MLGGGRVSAHLMTGVCQGNMFVPLPPELLDCRLFLDSLKRNVEFALGKGTGNLGWKAYRRRGVEAWRGAGPGPRMLGTAASRPRSQPASPRGLRARALFASCNAPHPVAVATEDGLRFALATRKNTQHLGMGQN